MMTKKIGGAAEVVSKPLRLAILVDLTLKFSMILVRINKISKNTAKVIPLPTALDLWKLATKFSCSINAKKMVPFEELEHKNVDFGGGLERITAASINSFDVFKISLLAPIIEKTRGTIS